MPPRTATTAQLAVEGLAHSRLAHPHPTRSLSPTGVGTLAPARLPAVGEWTHAAIRGGGNAGGGAACFEVHFPLSQQNNAAPLSTLAVERHKTLIAVK
mgnify:CR=1 FL=1